MSFDGLFDDTWDMQSLLQLNDNAPGRIDNQDPLANGLEGDGKQFNLHKKNSYAIANFYRGISSKSK